MKEIKIDDVVLAADGGRWYDIEGDLVDGGGRYDENGNYIPNTRYHTISRPILSIDYSKGLLRCVCGRVFLINKNLHIREY